MFSFFIHSFVFSYCNSSCCFYSIAPLLSFSGDCTTFPSLAFGEPHFFLLDAHLDSGKPILPSALGFLLSLCLFDEATLAIFWAYNGRLCSLGCRVLVFPLGGGSHRRRWDWQCLIELRFFCISFFVGHSRTIPRLSSLWLLLCHGGEVHGRGSPGKRG